MAPVGSVICMALMWTGQSGGKFGPEFRILRMSSMLQMLGWVKLVLAKLGEEGEELGLIMWMLVEVVAQEETIMRVMCQRGKIFNSS